MAVRAPKSLSQIVNPKTGLAMLEGEILAESAASLGHHGRKVERALAALDVADEAGRAALTDAAAREVWAYFIQRELCGLRDHTQLIKDMGIPQAVLKRLGAVR